ncbi:hypothetical protein PLEOSDRAFT_172242 [Pleurotus ostreatus PC15]|uniref:Uncharacterized protein n=1 Tax=Pleurotus ostreatus (strain PC15) TaxID=1137138 RepID=A0A067P4I3_PLEO1|nr:hypothetical protein PLEOSDRAFT_172242 [Pleurotus ostreatus PC15]
MAPTYIYYRVYDTNGVVNAKYTLPSEISSSKTIGRIVKSYIAPPFNVANVKLSIAQHEGHQAVFEAAGAQLFAASSQEEVTEKNGLLNGAGLSLTSPLQLKFDVALKPAQGRFLGKWQRSESGITSNDKYHYKSTAHFTLRKTPGGKIVADGHEHWTTTYTGFAGSANPSEKSLPSPLQNRYELTDFKVGAKSGISFTRTAASSGVTWKVAGDLSADGKWLTLTVKRVGSDAPVSRVFKRVV